MKSDAELFCAVAKELGYEFSMGELERYTAENQELDLDELEKAAGGDHDNDGKGHCIENHECWKDYSCGSIYNQGGHMDEYNRNGSCMVFWHCHMLLKDNDTGSKTVDCWNDYLCDTHYHHFRHQDYQG